MRDTNKNTNKEASSLGKQAKPLLVATAFGLVLSLIFLLVAAAVLSSKDIPVGFLTPISVICVSLGAFLGGFICAKLTKEKGLVNGIIIAVLLYIILVLCNLIFSFSGFGATALIKLFTMLVCGALGGFLGVSGKRRRR